MKKIFLWLDYAGSGTMWDQNTGYANVRENYVLTPILLFLYLYNQIKGVRVL